MSMPKEEIIGMVLEMYDARKEAKEYLEFYANPDEDGKLEEYKKIITEEFYPAKQPSKALKRMRWDTFLPFTGSFSGQPMKITE